MNARESEMMLVQKGLKIEDLLKESSLHLELPIPTRVVQYKMKSAAVYFVMSFSFKVFHVTCNLSAKSDYL